MTENNKSVAQGDRPSQSKLLVEIPHLALQRGELLDPVFSLTALHIASTRPDAASHWNGLALLYKDRALGLLRQSIVSVIEQQGSQDLEAMFNASICIAITTFYSTKRESASFVDILYAGGQLSDGTNPLMRQGVDATLKDQLATMSRETSDGSLISEDVREAFKHLGTLASSEKDSDGLRSGCVGSLWLFFEYCARGWYVTDGSGYGAIHQYSKLAERASQDRFLTLVIGVLMHSKDHRLWTAGLGRIGVSEGSASGTLQNPNCLPLMDWAKRRVGIKSETISSDRS